MRVPLQLYVYPGADPDSVQAVVQRSSRTCSPSTASVSRRELVVAVVLRVNVEKVVDPELTTSKVRWTEAPGDSPVASTSSRLVTAPVAPSTIRGTPVATACPPLTLELKAA